MKPLQITSLRNLKHVGFSTREVSSAIVAKVFCRTAVKTNNTVKF